MPNITKRTKRLFFFFATIILFGGSLLLPKVLDSANLTNTKDILESSRLSFDARNDGVQTAGGSIIKISASGPSTTTANLFPEDFIQYVSSGNTYQVDQIIDSDEFSITTSLGTGDTAANAQLIVNRTATHTISFTTASAIPNGSIRVKIKAPSANGNNNLPDQDGFDFNSITNASITCPTDVSGYQFGTGGQITATASGGTNCTSGYHCFECRYAGTGNVGTGLTMVIGGTIKLINPAPASGHTAGTADAYAFVVENVDANNNVIDSTTGKVAVVESVRVTATIDPTITFSITNRGIGTTSCGVPARASSTATAVPFGSIVLGAFNDMAQQLSVVTNAVNGYVVTAIEDDQLSISGEGIVEIADTDCDNEDCSYTTNSDWSTENDSSGFGYSLENIDANYVPFYYNQSGTFQAKAFASAANSHPPQLIMRNTSTPTTTEDIYVCYRLAASSTQPSGDYENSITYVATATF